MHTQMPMLPLPVVAPTAAAASSALKAASSSTPDVRGTLARVKNEIDELRKLVACVTLNKRQCKEVLEAGDATLLQLERVIGQSGRCMGLHVTAGMALPSPCCLPHGLC